LKSSTTAPIPGHQAAGEVWFRGRIKGFVTGGPYSGKTRTIKVAGEIYAFQTFETSDALKECSQSALALDYMRRGLIVPFETVCLALREKVETLPEGVVAIPSGFPRDIDQARFAVTLGLPIAFVNTPIETCALRAFERLTEIQSGNGERDLLRQGRVDEGDPAVTKQRFGVFCLDTLPALSFCRDAGLIRDIDGSLEPRERALRLGEIFDLPKKSADSYLR